jgi:uncharacterized protein YigE (DUF2233 family)
MSWGGNADEWAAFFFRDGLGCKSALYLNGVISVMYCRESNLGSIWVRLTC